MKIREINMNAMVIEKSEGN